METKLTEWKTFEAKTKTKTNFSNNPYTLSFMTSEERDLIELEKIQNMLPKEVPDQKLLSELAKTSPKDTKDPKTSQQNATPVDIPDVTVNEETQSHSI